MSHGTRLAGPPLQTERLPNGRRKLLRDLDVHCDGLDIRCPADMNTDFTTAPFFVRPFVHWARVDIAGVVHDHLYQTGALSRWRADRIWRLVARAGERHANLLQAWGGWLLLRIGGWYAWNKYRNGSLPSR